MTSVCPACTGRGRRGKQLCRRCNPSGALGDIVLGWLGRLGDRLVGRRTTTDGRTTTRRANRFGTETVTLTAAGRKARQKTRQPRQRRQSGQRTGRPAASEVHGQQSSTAARTGRCGQCRGVYGLLKGGQVRAHKDLRNGQRCPGSGKPPGGRKPTAAGQGTRGAQPRTQPAPAGPAGPGTSAGGPAPAARQQIIAKVCATFKNDNLQPHEVVLNANGEILIDRRERSPWAKPIVVGRWKGASG